MPLVIPFTSELVQLATLRDLFDTMTLHLYKNDYTPLDTSDVLDFVEADFSGYAAQLANAWGIPFFDVDRGRINEVIHDFIHSGGAVNNSIYGYYFTYTDGSLAWAERNPLGPVTVGPSVTYSVLPTYTLRDDV